MVYIASRIDTNIRELEGALTRVVAYASLNHQAITTELVAEAFKNIFPANKTKEITLEVIQEIVASYFKINIDDLLSKKRPRNLAFPRQIAMGERIIQEIRFGPPPVSRTEAPVPPDPSQELLRASRQQVLSPEKEAAAQRLCQGVADDELRQSLTRIYKKQLQVQQAKAQRDWHPCRGCGVLCPPESQWCTACEREQRQQTAARIQEILAAMAPPVPSCWLRY